METDEDVSVEITHSGTDYDNDPLDFIIVSLPIVKNYDGSTEILAADLKTQSYKVHT